MLQENLGIECLIKKRLNQNGATLPESFVSESFSYKISLKLKPFCKTFCLQHINISDGKPFCQKIFIQL